MESIAVNIQDIHEQVKAACLSAGRPLESVRLIAVSKTKPASLIKEAFLAGQIEFGESYVQEFLLEQGVERFYEIGPGRVLAGLMRRINRQAEVVSVNSRSALEKLMN